MGGSSKKLQNPTHTSGHCVPGVIAEITLSKRLHLTVSASHLYWLCAITHCALRAQYDRGQVWRSFRYRRRDTFATVEPAAHTHTRIPFPFRPRLQQEQPTSWSICIGIWLRSLAADIFTIRNRVRPFGLDPRDTLHRSRPEDAAPDATERGMINFEIFSRIMCIICSPADVHRDAGCYPLVRLVRPGTRRAYPGHSGFWWQRVGDHSCRPVKTPDNLQPDHGRRADFNCFTKPGCWCPGSSLQCTASDAALRNGMVGQWNFSFFAVSIGLKRRDRQLSICSGNRVFLLCFLFEMFVMFYLMVWYVHKVPIRSYNKYWF